jgi:glycosyltransferase involved in cell wall biosynthesis
LSWLTRSGNHKFLIVGESDDQDYAATIQPKIEQNSQILSLGYRRDIENIYHTSDIIVMPSQWDEPFGRIAIEAGAARKPIIATKVGGLPEIIEHGRNGYLVAKDDFASLLLYTRQLIRDGELRKTIGEEGRKIVEEKFSLKKHLREVEKIYERLL